MDLKSMASANRLHVNLRGHQSCASYEHFQTLLAIRGIEPDEDLAGRAGVLLDTFGS